MRALVSAGVAAWSVAASTGTVAAHVFGPAPGLVERVQSADLAVRGKIEAATVAENGALVAELRVEKVLKGKWSGARLRFASDRDHGVRYAAGERVVVFFSGAGPGGLPMSPQKFGEKFRITSFDPTGYDAFVTGLVEASAARDAVERNAKFCALRRVAAASHEARVREASVPCVDSSR